MRELRSFCHDDDVSVGTQVWWKDGDGYSPDLRLGRVVGTTGCWLVVQTGPDEFNDVIVRPRWCFYDASEVSEPADA